MALLLASHVPGAEPPKGFTTLPESPRPPPRCKARRKVAVTSPPRACKGKEKGRRGRGLTGGEGTSASPSSLQGPAPLCGAGWREFGLKGVNSSVL